MELKSASNGTYNKEGRKESKGSKLIVRSWAVDRNINDNNELYVFNEEETDRLDEKRQAYKLEQSQIKVESSEDKLAAAMVKALGNINAVPAKVEEVEEVDTLEDLKTIIKENDLGIRIAKGDSRAKVEAKIKEAQK
tara:strand:- start:290 stop:700 length:411 start_codon:yes stop_codon:yes gene_type:complete